MDERDNELEEKVSVASCHPSTDISQDGDAGFESERMTGKDVKVEIVGLHVFEHDVIAGPVVAHIPSESQEENEKETTWHPHTLTKRHVQTVVAQGEYRKE